MKKVKGSSNMDAGRYINPYTDFGFKKLFGTEMNKDLLISFLNALFNGREQEITDVEYLNAEHLGEGYGDRRAVFDVYCKTADGSRFIVEMQKAEQEYFKDRSIYYSTFAIREQAVKGKEWNYHLDDVYTVGVLNFVFPNGEYPSDSLCPHYSEIERRQYFESQKEYWDYYSTMQTALNKGRAEGLKQGRAEGIEQGRAEGRAEGFAEGEANERIKNAINLKANGVPSELIAKSLGISIEEIEGL